MAQNQNPYNNMFNPMMNNPMIFNPMMGNPMMNNPMMNPYMGFGSPNMPINPQQFNSNPNPNFSPLNPNQN